MAALHPSDTVKRRVVVIPDHPPGNWMYRVVRDSTLHMTSIAVMHLDPAVRGPEALTIHSAIIDPKGDMWGMDMDAVSAQLAPSTTRPDAGATFAAGRAARFALAAEDQKTVRAIIAWYDKRCPAK